MNNVSLFSGVSFGSSESCNLNCKYCYVPVFAKRTKTENKKLREWIKSGNLFKFLEKNSSVKDFGYIGLWGGEPTLNLDVIEPEIKKIIDYFPNFEKIDFSTNLSSDNCVDLLIDFITKVLDYKSSIKFHIQVSIDGPDFIHNKNRRGSDVSKVLSNAEELVDRCKKFQNPDETKIQFRSKTTLSAENIQTIIDPENFYNFFKFWDEALSRSNLEKVLLPNPSYVSPGKFTVKDGQNYAKLTNLLLNSNIKFNNIKFPMYDQHFRTLTTTIDLLRWAELGDENAIFRSYCSAGRDFFAFDKEKRIHWCQSDLAFNSNVIKQLEDRKESDFEKSIGFSYDNFDSFIKPIIVDSEIELDKNRLFYSMKATHDNLIFKRNYNEALINALLMSGQIDKMFYDKTMREIFSLYVTNVTICVMDGRWNTGDVHINTESFLKLLGNGAFKIMSEHIVNKENERKQ
jgi:sulfatase maturation enzyme AslB (radical SAM superfamily)